MTRQPPDGSLRYAMVCTRLPSSGGVRLEDEGAKSTVNDVNRAIGERVRLVMWRKKVTQTALAAQLGMSQPGLGKKIHGERAWSVEDLLQVAEALGVQVGDLLPEGPPPSPEGHPPPPVSSGCSSRVETSALTLTAMNA